MAISSKVRRQNSWRIASLFVDRLKIMSGSILLHIERLDLYCNVFFFNLQFHLHKIKYPPRDMMSIYIFLGIYAWLT